VDKRISYALTAFLLYEGANFLSVCFSVMKTYCKFKRCNNMHSHLDATIINFIDNYKKEFSVKELTFFV